MFGCKLDTTIINAIAVVSLNDLKSTYSYPHQRHVLSHAEHVYSSAIGNLIGHDWRVLCKWRCCCEMFVPVIHNEQSFLSTIIERCYLVFRACQQTPSTCWVICYQTYLDNQILLLEGSMKRSYFEHWCYKIVIEIIIFRIFYFSIYLNDKCNKQPSTYMMVTNLDQ